MLLKEQFQPFLLSKKERREPLKKEKPSLSNKELISTMSTEWNNMNETAKKKYVELAEEDKKRYEKEKAAYDAKQKGGKKSAKKDE